MKFTITRINKQNKLMVSSKTVERFLERIAKDDAKLSVTNFRMSVPLMETDHQYYKGIKEWQHVYPAAEFNKDESGNLVFQKSNGLVMFHFINLMSDQEKDAVKKTVSLLPMTFAAFEGADGRSLIVLVSICNEEGKIPTKEADADLLYQSAYEQVKKLYQSQVQAAIKPEKPSLSSNFMLTLDASPYYNSKAVAMSISQNMKKVASAPKNVDDLKTYDDYEFLYRKAAEETKEEMKKANISWQNDEDRFLCHRHQALQHGPQRRRSFHPYPPQQLGTCDRRETPPDSGHRLRYPFQRQEDGEISLRQKGPCRNSADDQIPGEPVPVPLQYRDEIYRIPPEQFMGWRFQTGGYPCAEKHDAGCSDSRHPRKHQGCKEFSRVRPHQKLQPNRVLSL